MSAQTPADSKTAPFAIATRCRRFDERVVVVTGAAQGLGRVIARRVAEEGASVVICDINEAQTQRAAQRLAQETGRPFLAFVGDLSAEGVADRMVAQTLERFGRLDSLVNDAAALIRMPLVDFTEELLRKVKAAQYVASHPGEVCPAKWTEGAATLKPSLDLVGKI
mgnify:CR=1 FL=1